MKKNLIKSVLLFSLTICFFIVRTSISNAGEGTINGACNNLDTLATCASGGYLEHSISGSGPWTWTCVGTSDGASATCSSGKNNPTHYVSLNGDYGRVTAIDSHGIGTVYNGNIRGYTPYFRIFIPPGTRSIRQGLIYEWSGQNIIGHHKSIPSTNFSDYTYQDGFAFTTLTPQNTAGGLLAAYEASDQFVGGVRPQYNNGRLDFLNGDFGAPYLSVSRSGWFYVKIDDYKPSSNPAFDIAFYIEVDPKTYNDWYDHSGSNPDGSINWAKDVEGVTTYTAIPPVDPTCNTKTCVGNSCWNGTDYVLGTKTQGCATGSAQASPASITTNNSTYVTWNSANASKMDVACLTGPAIVSRTGWYLNDAECKNAGVYTACTDKGIELKFAAGQTGTEVCTFYPTNVSDGLPGTPFTVSIEIKNPGGVCGDGICDDIEKQNNVCPQDCSVVNPNPLVYVTFYSHNEDGDYWGTLANDPNAYAQYRADLIKKVKLIHQYGATLNWESDSDVLLAMAKNENGNLLNETNGKNILRWMTEDMGVVVDPHGHLAEYNYADLAYLIEQLGVKPSSVIGGFALYDCTTPSNFKQVNWRDSLSIGADGMIHGKTYPNYSWKPKVLAQPAMIGHAFDDFSSGVWKPKLMDFLNQDNGSDLVYVGQGYPHYVENIGKKNSGGGTVWYDKGAYVIELLSMIRSGKLPKNQIYTASVHLRDQPSLPDVGSTYDSLKITLDVLKSYADSGQVIYKNYEDVAATWREKYSSKSSRVDISKFSVYDKMIAEVSQSCSGILSRCANGICSGFSSDNSCGNGVLDSGEVCDGANHPCAAGKSCTNCKCVTTNPGDPEIQRICKTDNPNCAKETCKNYYCWDGCGYVRGVGNNCD